MNQQPITILCPVKGVTELLPYAFSEIKPLLDYLKTGELPAENRTFPRGTVTPDGRLDLCKQELGPEGCAFVVEALWEHPGINSILLGTDGIGNSGAGTVATLIRQSPNLETVYLGCNLIEAEGIASLAAAIRENETVTGLWLKRNPIGAAGAEEIAGLLRHNKTLKTLDLVNTQIGAAGLRAICAALAYENRALEHIYLGGNNIGPEEMGSVGEVLRHNTTLSRLMLPVNNLGETGGIRLADALRENTSLRELGLGSCDLNGVALGALFEALQQHPNIRYLDLSYAPSTVALGARGNRFSERSVHALAAFLIRTTSLEVLNLNSAGIPEDLSNLIIQSAAQNPVIHKVTGLRSKKPLPDIFGSSDNTLTPKQVSAIKSVYRTI